MQKIRRISKIDDYIKRNERKINIIIFLKIMKTLSFNAEFYIIRIISKSWT